MSTGSSPASRRSSAAPRWTEIRSEIPRNFTCGGRSEGVRRASRLGTQTNVESNEKGLRVTSLRSDNPHAVVIGAGPYGLAAAAHLIGRGVSVRVFGEPMSAWLSNMPRGMFLKSEPSASDISAPSRGYGLADYCRAHGMTPLRDGEQPIPIELFTSYGTWFQEQLVPVERERITNVAANGGRFDVTLASGEVINTPSVLVASG